MGTRLGVKWSARSYGTRLGHGCRGKLGGRCLLAVTTWTVESLKAMGILGAQRFPAARGTDNDKRIGMYCDRLQRHSGILMLPCQSSRVVDMCYVQSKDFHNRLTDCTRHVTIGKYLVCGCPAQPCTPFCFPIHQPSLLRTCLCFSELHINKMQTTLRIPQRSI